MEAAKVNLQNSLHFGCRNRILSSLKHKSMRVFFLYMSAVPSGCVCTLWRDLVTMETADVSTCKEGRLVYY